MQHVEGGERYLQEQLLCTLRNSVVGKEENSPYHAVCAITELNIHVIREITKLLFIN